MTANVHAPEWDVEREREGFRCRIARLGERLGAELLGASVWELPPGERSVFHLHHANEELAIVLEGRPTLRSAEGERELAPGDAVTFRRGPDGAHGFVNRSAAPARYVVFSTMVHPDVVEYPDSGTVGVIAGAAPRPGREAPLELFLDPAAQRDRYGGR